MDAWPPNTMETIMWTNKSMLKTIAVFMAGWLLAGVAISCNTIEGAGKDTERAGEKIQDAADRNR
jgi:predicted small secreted protein